MSVPSISIENKNSVVMLIDEEDLGLITQHRNGHWDFSVWSNGTAFIKGKGNDSSRRVALHRSIMALPTGSNIKHINGNKLDNRRENLKICIAHEYERKGFRLGLSKFRGVSKNGNNWRAVISTRGVTTHLGTFPTEVEAAKAYDVAAKVQHHKDGAVNFPDKVRESIMLGSSKFRGVWRNGNNWRAVISSSGVTTHLGTFTNELEAAQAYDAAAKLGNCDFRTLNFPDEATNV